MWLIETTDIFDDWFAGLNEAAQVEIIATVELLKLLGPRLGRPHADTLNGSRFSNMKELRANTATEVLRIAFAFDPERNGILLVGGDKSGISQKLFYNHLINKADQLYESHLAALKTKKEGRSLPSWPSHSTNSSNGQPPCKLKPKQPSVRRN